MTDRDHFAAAAFPCCHQEIFGEGRMTGYPCDWRDQIVRQAYAYADAMLRERSRDGQKIAKCDSFCSDTNHDAAPAARASESPCAGHAGTGGTKVGVSATGAESGSTPDAQGFGRSNEYPCQPFDSAPTTDQERFVRFQSAVMNWISEATGFFHDDVLRTDDARDVITDACSRCWDAFDRISFPSTNHDAAPAARASVGRPRTDKADLPTRCGTGNTPVTEPLPVFVSGSGSVTPVSYAKTDENRFDFNTKRDTSSRDQELKLKHGIEGSPMIKAQTNAESELERLRGQLACTERERDSLRVSIHNLRDYVAELNAELYAASAAKTDTTPPRNGALSDGPDPDSRVWETQPTPQPHATPPQGSVQGESSFRDSQNAIEPVAWAVAGDYGDYAVKLFADKASAVLEADRRGLVGLRPDYVVVPLYRHPQPTRILQEQQEGE